MSEDATLLDFIAKHDDVHPRNIDGCFWCGGSQPYRYTKEQILEAYKVKHG